jgi:glucose-6-phosphate 1-dehydrogenase
MGIANILCSPVSRLIARASRQRCEKQITSELHNRKITVGKIGDTVIPAYRESKDVGPDSTTETYVALKRQIDNWRWAGVPFYLRTGKALSIKRTEVAIKFREAPFAMFERTPVEQLAENYLVIGIEPTEGVMLQFNTKCPVPRSELAACK